MDQIWDRVIKTLAGIGGAIAGAFGGWDALLGVLIGAMAADYVSGLVVAWMGKSQKTEYGGLSSKVGAHGLAKKGLMMLVVVVASLLDRAMGTESPVCRDAACWFYIANEGISMLENLGLAGIPFPKKLMELLGQKKAENDEGKTDNGGGAGPEVRQGQRADETQR